MESFDSRLLRKLYEKVSGLGDRLAKIDSAIDEEAVIWRRLYPNLKWVYRVSASTCYNWGRWVLFRSVSHGSLRGGGG
ncbi:MAG: hypothetical protein WC941_02230 [Candidatus Bathyarchaeia archaeon]